MKGPFYVQPRAGAYGVFEADGSLVCTCSTFDLAAHIARLLHKDTA